MPLFANELAPPGYVLSRSRRRTIAIHVHVDRVEVRAPIRASQRDIDAFVQAKSVWIQARLVELHERSVDVIRVGDGCSVEVMGEQLTIRWRLAAKGDVQRIGDELFINGRALDEPRARRLFLVWLSGQARERLLPMAALRIDAMCLSHRLSGFTLRYTRTLWGRCSSRGNILFNPLILLAPLQVIDYLIVHEACHLQHMNHSAAFWEMVGNHAPVWQQSRYWLKEHGHRLHIG